MHQVGYSTEGWNAIISQPQDRIEAVRSAVEKLGGKVVSGWFSFGQYDVVAITEMPDHEVRQPSLSHLLAEVHARACKQLPC
jgi:uncharacterized protein with GYD domain